jgi:hypothetical protein
MFINNARFKTALAAVTALALFPCAHGAVQVKLSISEPVGVARKNEPVSSGVCFKPGEVKDLARLALIDADGQPVPAQFSPLVKLEDGSFQWVLVDFQSSVAAGARATFTVKEGTPKAPAQPVVVKEAGGVYTVANGQIEFVVDTARPEFELFRTLKVNGKPVLTGLGRDAMTSADALDNGKIYRAGKPTKVAWDYQGPMRATLMIEGPYRDDAGVEWLGYRVRITCFADSKLLRVEHCLRNSSAKEVRHAKVKETFIRLGTTEAAAGKPTGDFMNVGSLFIKHRLISGYASPTLHEMSAEGQTLTLAVVPPFAAFDPKTHRGYNEGGWWSYDCTYKMDEWWLGFDSGDATLAKALDSRLMALAACDTYSDCAALGFGPFGSLEDEANTYQKWGWKEIEPRKSALLGDARWIKAQPGYYKHMDWVHDETETDDAEGCLLMALRTGGRGYFDAGLAWARYYANNFIERQDFPFGTARGKGQPMKFEGKDKEIMQYGESYGTGRTCGCHYYGAGAMDYYCMTGEKELLLGSIDLAKYARRGWEKKVPGKDTVGSWGTRGFGRQFMAVVRIYEVTRDPEWKKLMDHMAQLCIKDPAMIRDGDWAAIHSGGSNGMEKKHMNEVLAKSERLKKYMADKGLTWDEAASKVRTADGKSWDVYDMAGSWEQNYVQQGMERYWRLTGDKDAGDYVVKFANFFHTFSWDPHCQQVGYRLWGVQFPEKGMCLGSQSGQWFPAHDTCPGPGAQHDGWYTRFGPDVAARAYNVSQDKKYLEQAKAYWNRGSKWGYHVTKPSVADDVVGKFATHVPPKDDDILATALMFRLVPRVK